MESNVINKYVDELFDKIGKLRANYRIKYNEYPESVFLGIHEYDRLKFWLKCKTQEAYPYKIYGMYVRCMLINNYLAVKGDGKIMDDLGIVREMFLTIEPDIIETRTGMGVKSELLRRIRIEASVPKNLYIKILKISKREVFHEYTKMITFWIRYRLVTKEQAGQESLDSLMGAFYQMTGENCGINLHRNNVRTMGSGIEENKQESLEERDRLLSKISKIYWYSIWYIMRMIKYVVWFFQWLFGKEKEK